MKPTPEHLEAARKWLGAEEQMAKANWPMGRPSGVYVYSLAYVIAEREALAAESMREWAGNKAEVLGNMAIAAAIRALEVGNG